jgi:hypothetical protein
MAATKTVQDSINWVKPFVNWANLTIGTNQEPALTSANLSLQTIVGPPFVWPWNRNNTFFLTTVGQQDYTVSLSNFGFLEAASIELCGTITHVTVTGNVAVFTAVNGFSTLPNGGQGTIVTTTGCTTSAYNGSFPIVSCDAASFTVDITTPDHSENESGALAVAGPSTSVELKWGALSEDRALDKPGFISTQMSDESGTSYTFRLMPVPENNYRVNLIYQESPTLLFDVSNTWGIPDQLQYIYNYFFAFFMCDYFDLPEKTNKYRQMAVAALLARQSGLSQTDRNLFLGNWLPLMQEENAALGSTQQGTQAKGI